MIHGMIEDVAQSKMSEVWREYIYRMIEVVPKGYRSKGRRKIISRKIKVNSKDNGGNASRGLKRRINQSINKQLVGIITPEILHCISRMKYQE